MSLRDDFARNLRKYRHEKGLSQEALAHDAGLTRSYMSDLERSVYSASLDMVEKIAEILKVEPATLLERAPKRSSRKSQ